jgi:hypothetical protein
MGNLSHVFFRQSRHGIRLEHHAWARNMTLKTPLLPMDMQHTREDWKVCNREIKLVESSEIFNFFQLNYDENNLYLYAQCRKNYWQSECIKKSGVKISVLLSYCRHLLVLCICYLILSFHTGSVYYLFLFRTFSSYFTTLFQ